PVESLDARRGPGGGRHLGAERAFEFGAFARTRPPPDKRRDPRNIVTRRCFPVVESLLPLLEHRPLQPADADDPLELDEDLWHSVQTGLVDPRLDSAFGPVRPAFAIKETRGPGEIVVLQPRDLDRTQASCLSSKRANTSHKVSTASAIFDDMPGTNVRVV